MTHVQVENLIKNYGKEQVLKNISLTIEEGEIFGLIGPNGAGKSTLIDSLTGLTNFQSGDITIDSKQVPKDLVSIREDIGLVPQEIALLEDLNAKANLEYFGGLYNLSGKDLKNRIDEALKIVELDDQEKKVIKKYSGGMKRRLNIAAAILHRPKFLILDEPTVGVDPQSRNKIFDFIRYMNKEYGTAILYTSHYMEEVEALCDRLLIIDNGEQIAYGSQEEIKQLVQNTVKWRVEFTEVPTGITEEIQHELDGVDQAVLDKSTIHLIVDPAIFNTQDLLTFIADKDIGLKTLVKEELSLEEAFLQLTGKSLRD